MGYNPTTNTIDTDTVQGGQSVTPGSATSPAFQSGGYTAPPIQPGQNIGSATTLGNVGNQGYGVGAPANVSPQPTTQPIPPNMQPGGPANSPGGPVPGQQPNPQSTTPATGAPYTIKPGDSLSQIAQAQGTTVAQLMALNPQITDANKINAGQSLNTKYNNALQAVTGTPPNSQGDASSAVKDAITQTSPNPVDTSQQQAGIDAAKSITEKMNADPGFQQLMADHQAYLSQASQQTSLQDEYTKLTADAGIPALNSQLINMKSIMDGTEDDIRNEITKAGGFATNSQVMALTAARNKVMIQNYNNLLQTRDDAVNQINTTMGFAKEDQANAQALATEKMNYDQQIISYEQKFTAAAQDSLKSMQQTEGWDGIYKAALASGDPSAIQRINSTMGNGFDIRTMALADAQTKLNALQAQQATQANVAADNARANASLAEQIRHNKVDEANAANKPLSGTYTPAQKDTLIGVGMTAPQVDQVSQYINQYGVQAFFTANPKLDSKTKSAINKLYGTNY